MAVWSLGAVLLLGTGFQTLQVQHDERILYFPHLAVGASWQTTITYINYSPQEVTCQTEFISDHGAPLLVSFPGQGMDISRTDVLPPGGSVHQETNVDLSAPLAPGWARATCSGPVKASLLFRRYNSEGVPVAEAGVNATTVPATGFVTFAEQREGQFGTGVAYANPSDTAAHITFTARDAAGQTLASANHTLPPGGHGAQNMVDLFGLTSFSGSLEVTSTEPIVSLSLNFEADPVFSSLPPGELDAVAQGATNYYFPHLAMGANWQTTITYINYSPQEVTCQTEFISDHGAPLLVSFPGQGMDISRTDVLPPGGSVHQETNVELSAPLSPGWAWAICSGPVKASLLFRRYNSEGVPVAEGAVNAAADSTTRFVTFAERQEGKAGTGVAYANRHTAGLVTFTAKDAAGQTLARVDRTLLPNGHGAQNMVGLFGLTSFTGSLEITSTEPIVSLALNFEADPVFSSLPPGEIVDSPDIPVPEGPDLVVQAPSVSDSNPNAGESFVFTSTVRNQGSSESTPTTLRYYLSTDALISTSDTEVGTGAVGSLSASGVSHHSISLTAPSDAWTYYYGACVDPVSGESAASNNCSSAVSVRVGGGGVPSGGSFDLDPANGDALGITFANGRLHVVNPPGKVYAYTVSGQRDAAADFDLHSDNDFPTGIAFANGRFHVVDYTNGKVYAYTATGQRDPAADFDLDPANGDPRRITFANGRFHVVDHSDGKVYAYTATGQRDAAADFDLDPANRYASGIAFANGRFHVVDYTDATKVYAYTATGQRNAAADFDLDPANRGPAGITFANGSFYVVDETDDKVYAYPGGHLDGLDSDGDGVPDAEDAFPLNPTEWADTDGDGIGNNADADDGTDPSGTVTVAGRVSVDGPIDGANVLLTAINGAPIAATSTSPAGDFALTLNASTLPDPFVVVASGGRIQGEDGERVEVGGNVRAYLPKQMPATVNITPLTEFIYQEVRLRFPYQDTFPSGSLAAEILDELAGKHLASGNRYADLLALDPSANPSGVRLSYDLIRTGLVKAIQAGAGTDEIANRVASLLAQFESEGVGGGDFELQKIAGSGDERTVTTIRPDQDGAVGSLQQTFIDDTGSVVDVRLATVNEESSAVRVEISHAANNLTIKGKSGLLNALEYSEAMLEDFEDRLIRLDVSDTADSLTVEINKDLSAAISNGELVFRVNGREPDADELRIAEDDPLVVWSFPDSGLSNPLTDHGVSRLEDGTPFRLMTNDEFRVVQLFRESDYERIAGLDPNVRRDFIRDLTKTLAGLLVPLPEWAKALGHLSTVSDVVGILNNLPAIHEAFTPSTRVHLTTIGTGAQPVDKVQLGQDYGLLLLFDKGHPRDSHVQGPSLLYCGYTDEQIEFAENNTTFRKHDDCIDDVHLTLRQEDTASFQLGDPFARGGCPDGYTREPTYSGKLGETFWCRRLEHERYTDKPLGTLPQLEHGYYLVMPKWRPVFNLADIMLPREDETVVSPQTELRLAGQIDHGFNLYKRGLFYDIDIGEQRLFPVFFTTVDVEAGEIVLDARPTQVVTPELGNPTYLWRWRDEDGSYNLYSGGDAVHREPLSTFGFGVEDGGFVEITLEVELGGVSESITRMIEVDPSGSWNSDIVTDANKPPDLVVQDLEVSDSSPNVGESFTLSATVRNQGNGQSAATTLRIYRSSDDAISTGDTEVGTGAVGSLSASGVSHHSISLTAPSAAGTYYYGACVDPVSGESAASNNCSSAVSVRVGGGGVPSGGSFDLDPANGDALGITFANGRLHVVNPPGKVYAYTVSGQRDAAADFDLDPANGLASGITFANGRFYLVDNTRKVYAYTASGRRDPAADFDLVPVTFPRGITFANGRFHVLDYVDRKVYAYTASGQRDAAADFDLDPANSSPPGITFANGRLHVLDDAGGKVYAYTASGQRDAAADFDLDPANGLAWGITFANGGFYVVDWRDDKVYAYPAPGPATEAPDLVVETPSVSDSSPNAGESFTFSVTVRNQGNGPSAATTLRIYRSSDAVISTNDTEIDTSPVSSLSASRVSGYTTSLTAPSTAGTYYYGACVDPVAGETATGNNCSSAVAVRVSGSGGAAFINLDAANDDATGIAFANGRFYVVDTADDKVYVYTGTGQRAAASDFNLDAANGSPYGITFANGRFYVVDLGDDKVYVYTGSGQRAAASDFNLDAANDGATGIAFANGRFYVVDVTDRKVYAYTATGQRAAASDFDLDAANNRNPTGIAFANGRFYVVDRTDDKVYAYTGTGQPDPASDFDLYRTIMRPGGITFANGWFYVVDEDAGAIPHTASGYPR